MNRSTWRAWLATLPMAALLAIVAIAASPPTAAALTPANTKAPTAVVVVKNVDVIVTATIKVVSIDAAELQKLDGLHVAWLYEDMPVMKIANINGSSAVSAFANTANGGTATINVTPTPVNDTNFITQNISPQGARVQPINDARDGSTYSTETMQPASNPARLDNTANLSLAAPRSVALATTAGGWLDTALAVLSGRLDGRVS